MIGQFKRHYNKLKFGHKAILATVFIIGSMVSLFSSIFATLLPFQSDLTTIFPGLDTGNYSTVHFAYGGNDYAGLIFRMTGEVVIPAEQITINGGTQEIACSQRLKGLYYNNMRGRRLWPLDTGSLAILSGQGSGYDTMTMTGGFYTDCTGAGTNPYPAASNEVFGYIEHVWSGIIMTMEAGVEYDFAQNEITPGSPFSGSLISTGGSYSGFLFDSLGGIADVASGQAGWCGDGDPQVNEQCDDGNDINNDGCSDSCAIEMPTPICTGIFTYPSTGTVGDTITFVFSGNRGSGLIFSGFHITNPADYTWGTTGPTSYSFIPNISGLYMGNISYANIYSGAFSGACDWQLDIEDLACTFNGSDTSITSGDNIDFTCAGADLTGYILEIWSGVQTVLSGIIYTGADSYTRTTGSTLPVGLYRATCAGLYTGATGPQCDDAFNFTVVSGSVTPSCPTDFQGNVTPANAVFASGWNYFSNTTGITLDIFASENVSYTLTGSFTSTPLTGSFTGTSINKLIYLTGMNTRNNIYSTFDTGSCGPYIEAVRRIYVDTVGPEASIPYSPTGGTGICNASTLALSRSAATDSGAGLSGYQYVLTNVSGLVYSGIVTGTSTTLSTSIMALGNYTWKVNTIDALGNTTPGTATGGFIIGSGYCTGVVVQTGVRILSQLASITNADLNKIYSSEIFYIIGLTGTSLLSIDTGTLIINGTGIATTGLINQGDQLRIELVSSDEYDTTVTSTISIAGITGTFNVTTKTDACNLTRTQQLAITRIYGLIKDQYDGTTSLLNDFMATFQNILNDEVDVSEDCTLSYMLDLINDDYDSADVDTSNHIAPNCKEYKISYNDSEEAYYSPMMKNRYYFINRETLIRHIDFYNAGDCHINTYGNVSWSDNRNTETIHVAPNGKIYHLQSANGGYTSSDFAGSKYFDYLSTITSYIDSKNPATDVRVHTVNRNFTPITYLAPNSKEYRIYSTSRGYMSYKLMKVKYFTSLAELQSYINKNNPVKK